jgi:hypothetical protein
MCCNIHIVHFRALHTKIWLFGRGRRARVNSRAISLLAPVALRASRSGELQSVLVCETCVFLCLAAVENQGLLFAVLWRRMQHYLSLCCSPQGAKDS